MTQVSLRQNGVNAAGLHEGPSKSPSSFSSEFLCLLSLPLSVALQHSSFFQVEWLLLHL